MQTLYLALIAMGVLIALAACAPPPAEPPTVAPTVGTITAAASLPQAIAESPSVAAPALIAAERAASAGGDLATLAQLWTEDARIVDGRGTNDTGDDYVWQGRDAIMDRYVLAVFPAPPPALDTEQLEGLVVTTEHERATAQLGIDRWTLVWRGGRWWLAELRYN